MANAEGTDAPGVLRVGDAGCPLRLVLLHGHAGSPEAMLEAATALADAVDVHVLLPRGPVAVEEGWAWWRTGSPCDQRSLQAVRALVASGPHPTVVAGFSQGGAMALLACATAPALAAGLVVVAGFVPDDLEGGGSPAPVALPPVLVLHGDQDEAVDPLHGRRVARWAEAAGAPSVGTVTYAAGHDWVPQTTTALVSWLGRLGLVAAPRPS